MTYENCVWNGVLDATPVSQKDFRETQIPQPALAPFSDRWSENMKTTEQIAMLKEQMELLDERSIERSQLVQAHQKDLGKVDQELNLIRSKMAALISIIASQASP
jgi:hypothetical protein